MYLVVLNENSGNLCGVKCRNSTEQITSYAMYRPYKASGEEVKRKSCRLLQIYVRNFLTTSEVISLGEKEKHLLY